MISALEHFSYCPRQCALIHLEQTFDENVFTVRGHLVHERVDEEAVEQSGDIRIERGVPLWSRRLGLVGRADIVEFHGRMPYPVEYKVGRRRRWVHEALQLCAQALCLEEMTGQGVPRGAVYYHGSRRRREVAFDAGLRQEVEATVSAVRSMLRNDTLPAPVNDERCRYCSLIDVCLPGVVGDRGRVHRVAGALFRPQD